MSNSANVKDVAAAAQVSVTTVSNVLNGRGRVSEATAKRVRAVMRELRFVRNDAARQLRAGRSRSIGLAVIDLSNPYFVDLARGADRRARQSGLQVIIGNSDREEARQNDYLTLFEEQRLRGVLLSPIGEPPEVLQRLKEHGTRTVLIDRDERVSGFASVGVDDVAGGYLAAHHLLESGRRRIAFIGAPATLKQAADRLAGARAAVAEVESARLDVIHTADVTTAGGRAAGAALIRRDFDGVFTANDLLALGVLQSVHGKLSVPTELGIIGFDDIELAASAPVPLSSVSQPTEAVGRTAVELLLREDSTEEHVVFQPELVIRASTSTSA